MKRVLLQTVYDQEGGEYVAAFDADEVREKAELLLELAEELGRGGRRDLGLFVPLRPLKVHRVEEAERDPDLSDLVQRALQERPLVLEGEEAERALALPASDVRLFGSRLLYQPQGAFEFWGEDENDGHYHFYLARERLLGEVRR